MCMTIPLEGSSMSRVDTGPELLASSVLCNLICLNGSFWMYTGLLAFKSVALTWCRSSSSLGSGVGVKMERTGLKDPNIGGGVVGEGVVTRLEAGRHLVGLCLFFLLSSCNIDSFDAKLARGARLVFGASVVVMFSM
jgi:hypothetical protein